MVRLAALALVLGCSSKPEPPPKTSFPLPADATEVHTDGNVTTFCLSPDHKDELAAIPKTFDVVADDRGRELFVTVTEHRP